MAIEGTLIILLPVVLLPLSALDMPIIITTILCIILLVMKVLEATAEGLVEAPGVVVAVVVAEVAAGPTEVQDTGLLEAPSRSSSTRSSTTRSLFPLSTPTREGTAASSGASECGAIEHSNAPPC